MIPGGLRKITGGLMRVVNDDKALRALLALVAGCAVLVYICSVAIAGISILESGKYVAGGLTLICAALAGVLLRAGERMRRGVWFFTLRIARAR